MRRPEARHVDIDRPEGEEDADDGELYVPDVWVKEAEQEGKD